MLLKMRALIAAGVGLIMLAAGTPASIAAEILRSIRKSFVSRKIGPRSNI